MKLEEIKELKKKIERSIAIAVERLKKEGIDIESEEFKLKIEQVKNAILLKLEIDPQRYSQVEILSEIEQGIREAKILAYTSKQRKISYNELENKPELLKQENIRGLKFSQLDHKDEDHSGILSRIEDIYTQNKVAAIFNQERLSIEDQLKSRIDNLFIPLKHSNLKEIYPDQHHKEKHSLESHENSKLMIQLKRLVGGGFVDDLHKHFMEELPRIVDIAGITKNDADSWYLRLDGTTTPVANISLGGYKITNLGTPTLDTDACTKAYADTHGGTTDHSLLSNLDYVSAGHTGFEPTITKGNLTTTTTGLAITGGISAVIGAGVTIDADTGYIIPTATEKTNWNTAYGWGDHSLAGYLTEVIADSPLSGLGTPASHLVVDLSSKQNVHANLTSLSGLTYVSASFVKMTGANTFTLDTNTYLTAEVDTLASVMGRGATTGIQLTSTLAIGTAPFAVTSTTVNTNLNADMLDGKHVGTSGNVVPLLDGQNIWSELQSYSAGIHISSIDDTSKLAIGRNYGNPKLWFYYDESATYPKIKWKYINEVGIQLDEADTGISYAPMLTALSPAGTVTALYVNKFLRIRAFSAATDSLIYLDNSQTSSLGGMALHPTFVPEVLEIYTENADIVIQPDAVYGFKTEINYDKGDCDFTIHGDTVDNVFFVDASKNLIGLSNSTPSSYLHQKACDRNYATGTIPRGTVPTSPIDGDYWYDNKQLCSMNFIDGMTQATVGCIFTQIASVTVNNTPAETTLIGSGIGTVTLPANSLAIGKTIRIMASGYYSTVGTFLQTLRMRIRLGGLLGTIILATEANAAQTAITNRAWRINAEITCRTLGLLGTVFLQGMFIITSTASAGAIWNMVKTTTSTINTTIAQEIVVSADWADGVAGDTITCTNLTVELLN